MTLTDFSKQLDETYLSLRGSLAKIDRSYDWRMSQLSALKRLITENDDAISDALWSDLRKSKFECMASEQGVVLSEIEVTLKNLKKWMKPRKVSTPLFSQFGSSQIVFEPYGLTLIIGTWNYPINLTLAPLVGAIAGGNGAIVKPSEIAVHTGALLSQLIPRYLDPSAFKVVQGGKDETDLLLNKKFDLIFFTGSGPVGKIILQKAAEHLTPVVLELGGKSPAIVLPDADIKVCAKRIAWGKFMNAGQTCVAPDYVIVHSSVREHFLQELKLNLNLFYGEDAKASPDYCRIINSKNYDRLTGLLKSLTVLYGGAFDKDSLYISPTIVNAKPEDAVMQDEIFGPILPIVEMSDTTQIIDFINNRPKPLALYVFTQDKSVIEAFIGKTSSGSLCVNDDVIHMPIVSLPFGGVGASGMGNYHGKYSFKTFTHAKGILHKSNWFDAPFRYAPYTETKAKILKWLMS
jgi:aldehyde dehydrogenase (NAD+)